MILLYKIEDGFKEYCVEACDLKCYAFDAGVDLGSGYHRVVIDEAQSLANQTLCSLSPLLAFLRFHPSLNQQLADSVAIYDKCIPDNRHALKFLDCSQRLPHNRIIRIVSNRIPPVSLAMRRASTKYQE